MMAVWLCANEKNEFLRLAYLIEFTPDTVSFCALRARSTANSLLRLRETEMCCASKRSGLGIPNKPGDYAVLRKIKPDIVCVGYDQTSLRSDILQKIKAGVIPKIPIIRIRAYRPKILHTSILKK